MACTPSAGSRCDKQAFAALSAELESTSRPEASAKVWPAGKAACQGSFPPPVALAYDDVSDQRLTTLTKEIDKGYREMIVRACDRRRDGRDPLGIAPA